MWIFTQQGMISAVAHRDLKDSLLVRARVKAHLESFLGGREHEIETNDSADYRYRVLIPRLLSAACLKSRYFRLDALAAEAKLFNEFFPVSRAELMPRRISVAPILKQVVV